MSKISQDQAAKTFYREDNQPNSDLAEAIFNDSSLEDLFFDFSGLEKDLAYSRKRPSQAAVNNILSFSRNYTPQTSVNER